MYLFHVQLTVCLPAVREVCVSSTCNLLFFGGTLVGNDRMLCPNMLHSIGLHGFVLGVAPPSPRKRWYAGCMQIKMKVTMCHKRHVLQICMLISLDGEEVLKNQKMKQREESLSSTVERRKLKQAAVCFIEETVARIAFVLPIYLDSHDNSC